MICDHSPNLSLECQKSSEGEALLVILMADFSTFKRNNDFYIEIAQHSPNAYFELENRVKNFHSLNEREQQHELDLYHKILKHERACEEDSCAVVASQCEPIQTLILKDILPNTRVITSYSLLVCMIDIIKNHPLALEHHTQRMFLSLTCDLWQHEKIYLCRKSLELCNRIIPLLSAEDAQQILSPVVQYLRTCRDYLTEQDIDRLRSLDHTDFFYTPLTNMTCDKECIKLITQITLSLFLYHPMDRDADINKEFISEITDFAELDVENSMTALFDICCANDDDAVQLLDTVLTLYQQDSTSTQFLTYLQAIEFNPHTFFLFFLARCGNTHDIIIDLLLENDSEFLSYFHRYVVYATHHIKDLVAALEDDQDTFLTIIANTILVLEGDGLPYNTKPLVRRLVQLDTKLNDLLM